MKKALQFIGEIAGYWLWLAIFWGFLAIVALGINTDAGLAILALATSVIIVKTGWAILSGLVINSTNQV